MNNDGKINYEREINDLLYNADMLAEKLQKGKHLNRSDREALLSAISYIEQLKIYGELNF